MRPAVAQTVPGAPTPLEMFTNLDLSSTPAVAGSTDVTGLSLALPVGHDAADCASRSPTPAVELSAVVYKSVLTVLDGLASTADFVHAAPTQVTDAEKAVAIVQFLSVQCDSLCTGQLFGVASASHKCLRSRPNLLPAVTQSTTDFSAGSTAPTASVSLLDGSVCQLLGQLII